MIYLLISLAIIAVDLYVKHWIEGKESGFQKRILGDWVILRKSHNRGAILNFMDQRQELVAGFSAGLSVFLMIAYLCLLTRKGFVLLKTGTAFIVGGALSNVFDRLKRKYVVDYFSFNVKWDRLRKVVFNLADLFIFLGSFLVILWNSRLKS